MNERRVLVTGAGGFVGRALAAGFADLGWDVTGLDRAYEDGSEPARIRRVTADLEDRMSEDVPEVDLVVHAAWVTTDPGTLGITSAEYIGLNTRPLLAVLEYAARTSAAAFVFVSSSGVFAPTDATDGLTDADRPTGASPYAVAKRAAELLVPAAATLATAVHVVRLGYLFGPGEVARPTRREVSLVADWLAAAREGRPLAVRADDPARDWTFTLDLAAALERVVAGPSSGRPIHLGSPHVRRDSELATLIASEVPDTELRTQPAGPAVKPPMVPSRLAALRDFEWTDPHTGLRALMAAGVAA